MRFNWRSALLAPLAVPLLFSLVAGPLFGEHPSALGVLITLLLGCFVSYGTMFGMFLPSLFVLAAVRPVTWVSVCLLGLALGEAADVLLTLMAWKGSGPDSGPPEESFLPFFLRFSADPVTLLLPLSGLATSGLYWWLATRWPRPTTT